MEQNQTNSHECPIRPLQRKHQNKKPPKETPGILVNFVSTRTLPITVDQSIKQEKTASCLITIVQPANSGVKQC